MIHTIASEAFLTFMEHWQFRLTLIINTIQYYIQLLNT